MSAVKRAVIIYNPESTSGKSQRIALRFANKLHKNVGIPTEIIATEYVGHAEELARRYANRDRNTMIISASGDGGYHEIINGVLTSKHPDVVLGLLAAGNANDHYTFMHEPGLMKRINNGRVEHIDVLRVESSEGWFRYVHSYAGLGLTSQINDILKQYDYHPVREFGLAFWHALNVKPIRVTVQKKTKRLDNLLFLNAGRMSKMVKTTGKASICDGKFEVVEIKAGAVIDLARYFFRAVTLGVDDAEQAKTYQFTCEHAMGIQMDGERRQLVAGETITVTVAPRSLRCTI